MAEDLLELIMRRYERASTMINAICVAASSDLGGLESGLLASAIGAAPAVVLGGVATIAVVAIYARGPLRHADAIGRSGSG